MSTTVTLPIGEYYQLLAYKRLDEKIMGAKIVHAMIGKTGKLEYVSCLEENEAIRKITEDKEIIKYSHTQTQFKLQQQKELIKDIETKLIGMKKVNIYLSIMIYVLILIIVFLCFKLV